MMNIKVDYRTAILAALLLVCLAFVHGRGRLEIVPKPAPLSEFPTEVNGWNGRDVAMGQDVRETLGPGDFLSRLYQQDGTAASVDLFIGYFPSQKTGDTIHSPRHCLPGAGWTFAEFRRTSIEAAGARAVDANEYVIAKGPQKAFVLYWYQAHGRAVASEYWAKLYLVADAVRMNRTDGALVRIVTPFMPGEDIAGPRSRATAFAQGIIPSLGHYIPE